MSGLQAIKASEETGDGSLSPFTCSVPGFSAPAPDLLQELPESFRNDIADAVCQEPQPILFCHASG